MKIVRLMILGLLAASFGLAGFGQSSGQAAKTTKSDEKETGVIPGITIDRKDGKGFLGIEIVDGNFKLSFYNAKKKPVAADYARALLRWNGRYKTGDERYMLTQSSDGKSLVSPRVVRPPYLFKLFITLIRDGSGGESAEDSSETYTVDFRQ